MNFMNEPKFGFTFNTTDFELKQVGDELYVGGFVSVEELDENGDVTNQDRLLEKINDPTNPYAKYLSYKHKWIKGDKDDFSNALGVKEGDAVIKQHPSGKRGVFAEYHLLKTSPYYDAAVYDIKHQGVSGFSTEFKEAKRKDMTLGQKIVNYLDDFVFGGVGIVARPAVKSAAICGFYAKEVYFNTDETFETKVKQEGVEKMDIKEEVVNTPVVETQPVEDPKPVEEPKPVDVPKSDESPKTDEALDKIKEEIEAQKTEIEKLKLEQQRDKLKEELQSLKAQPRVLADPTPQDANSNDPANDKIQNILKEVEDVNANKKLSYEDKVKRLFDIEQKYK